MIMPMVWCHPRMPSVLSWYNVGALSCMKVNYLLGWNICSANGCFPGWYLIITETVLSQSSASHKYTQHTRLMLLLLLRLLQPLLPLLLLLLLLTIYRLNIQRSINRALIESNIYVWHWPFCYFGVSHHALLKFWHFDTGWHWKLKCYYWHWKNPWNVNIDILEMFTVWHYFCWNFDIWHPTPLLLTPQDPIVGSFSILLRLGCDSINIFIGGINIHWQFGNTFCLTKKNWIIKLFLLLSVPLSVCHVLFCNFQNKIKISPLLTSMQLLLAMAINWNTFNIFQSILRTLFESYTGQLC